MLGREGKSGAVEVADVDVAGLAAEGVVVVIAVDATGLPAVGADDNAFPVHRYDEYSGDSMTSRWKTPFQIAAIEGTSHPLHRFDVMLGSMRLGCNEKETHHQ